jgi:hypothetical protein
MNLSTEIGRQPLDPFLNSPPFYFVHAHEHPLGSFRFPAPQVALPAFRAHYFAAPAHAKPLGGGLMSFQFVLFVLFPLFLVGHTNFESSIISQSTLTFAWLS